MTSDYLKIAGYFLVAMLLSFTSLVAAIAAWVNHSMTSAMFGMVLSLTYFAWRWAFKPV